MSEIKYMEVVRTSELTGETKALLLKVTAEQLLNYEMGNGDAVDIFTELNADEIKYIETGFTPSDLPDILFEGDGDEHV